MCLSLEGISHPPAGSLPALPTILATTNTRPSSLRYCVTESTASCPASWESYLWRSSTAYHSTILQKTRITDLLRPLGMRHLETHVLHMYPTPSPTTRAAHRGQEGKVKVSSCHIRQNRSHFPRPDKATRCLHIRRRTITGLRTNIATRTQHKRNTRWLTKAWEPELVPFAGYPIMAS